MPPSGPRPPSATSPEARTPIPESSGYLLQQARTGDRDALDKLCARLIPRLRRWTRGRLPPGARDLVDTDDIVMTTLADAARRIGAFTPRWKGAFQVFLRTALRNRIVDEARRVLRRPPPVELPADAAGREPSPLEATLARETVERYQAALQRLRPEDQEAVRARIEMGYSYQEVARLLGKPTADAARMRVERALVRLAEEMRR